MLTHVLLGALVLICTHEVFQSLQSQCSLCPLPRRKPTSGTRLVTVWATPVHQTFDASAHRDLSAGSLSSFSPRNLRGWRHLISWGNLRKGKVSGRLIDESCLVYRYACWHRSKLSVSNADRRCAHLFGLRGILIHVARRGDLSVVFLTVFILSLEDILSRDLSYFSVSGGWLPFSSQGGGWVLRTAIGTQPEPARGQRGLPQRGPRPDLCLHPWKPVHHGHCGRGWVCLPLPQSRSSVSGL